MANENINQLATASLETFKDIDNISTEKKYNPYKNPRNLEDRSYLEFQFYETAGAAPISKYLLFYENLEVRESRKAIHAKYQPISRSSTLLAYTGAESRMFSLSFKFTLPHLEEVADLNNTTKTSPKTSKGQDKVWFLQEPNPNPQNIKAKFGDSIKHADFFESLEENPDIFTPRTNKAIDLIMYWVNLIRVSVLNNSEDPTKGPPVVRLNHGILYQDIPCAVVDYKMDYDSAAHGHDLKTLLPRVISFELTLQEIRVGNFGEFKVKTNVLKDNNAGWEVMFNGTNTIDPVRIP